MNVILARNVRPAATAAIVAAAMSLGACAGGSDIFSTGALPEPKPVVVAQTDPVCVTMASQIDALRREGSVDRLEKAADGKTSNVTVQRVALSKQAQLNKANADFIAKCGPKLPKTTVASVAPPAATAPAMATKAGGPAAAKTVVASESGVTVAKPATIVPPASMPTAIVGAPAQN